MLRPSRILFAFSLSGLLTGLLACSSDSSGGSGSGGGGGDGGGGGNGDGGGGGNGDGGGGGKDGGADAAATVVNNCNAFVDRSPTGESRLITWDFPVSTADERCMTVKVGQDVTFSGNFTVHPLVASGGDTPNPITQADAAGKVSFTKAGTFGYVCGTHPAMRGAIKVVE